MTRETGIDRRQLIAGVAGIAGVGGLASAAAAAGTSATTSKPDAVSVPGNGRDYARQALRSGTISAAAVQSRIRAVDGQSPAAGIRDNLAHMLEVIDKVQFFGGTKDLLCFHEFPLQGWNPWDRKELERLAITIPGPATS